MSRRFVAQLEEHEDVNQVFLVADKQLRANRNGNLYLQMRLADRTGSLTGMLWNASEQLGESFDGGSYLNVQGKTHVHNGALQIIVSRIEKIDAIQVDESEFVTLDTSNIDKLAARLSEMLRGVANFHLRNLAECFLVDETLMANFTKAPAGVKNHHAYRGGLLEHVVSLMEVVAVVSPLYESVDDDLLLLGAFLHDIGKTLELTYERDLAYSDEGQLIGHIVMAVAMLDEKVAQAEQLSGESFPRELHLRLKHMIVSHHGQYEFGSPKLPMTPEAIVLHYLDNIDAKLHSVGQLISEDMNSDSNWTVFQPSLGRKLFKGISE